LKVRLSRGKPILLIKKISSHNTKEVLEI